MTNKKNDKEATAKKNGASNGSEPTHPSQLPIKTNCKDTKIPDEYKEEVKKAVESGKLYELIGYERRHMEFSCGPIPPPQMFLEYKNADPRIADQFLAQWSKEMDHRHELDKKRIAVQEEHNKQVFAERKRGQTCATIICFAAFIVAVILGFLGHALTAGVIGGTSLVAIVTTFITGRLPMVKSKNENGRKLESEETDPTDKDS
ncbi:MAG: DUF2335 domain-containing protein [Desulfobacteraceae bacterium]|jgi:uncharacterized membrane protein